MLAFIVISTAAALSLRHQEKATTSALKLDPHCSEGIMNTEMTVCCQKDCGECSDTSNFCSASRQEEMGTEKHGRESTCCPASMTEVPSCEVSMAPCAIPESVRNPPDLNSITAAEVHAKDDCGEVIKATADTQHLNTAYVKFPEKGVGATTKDCGTYGTLIQAAAACSKDDDCLGFNAKPDGDATKPDCLYVASTSIEKTSDSSGQDLYLKVEDQYTGHKFNYALSTCTVKCGGGVRTPQCKSESRETMSMGICSAGVAMNADAELEETACHQQMCDPPAVDEAAQTEPYAKCFEDEVGFEGYYFTSFTHEGHIKQKAGWMGDGYYYMLAYGGDYEKDKISYTLEEVRGNGGAGFGDESKYPYQATFTCDGDKKSFVTDYVQMDLPEDESWTWDGTYKVTHPCACK